MTNQRHITIWGFCALVGVLLVGTAIISSQEAQSQTPGDSVMETGTQTIDGRKTFVGPVDVPTSSVAGEAVNNTRLNAVTGAMSFASTTITNGLATTNQLTATSNTLYTTINNASGTVSAAFIAADVLKLDRSITNGAFTGLASNQIFTVTNGIHKTNDNGYFASGGGSGSSITIYSNGASVVSGIVSQDFAVTDFIVTSNENGVAVSTRGGTTTTGGGWIFTNGLLKGGSSIVFNGVGGGRTGLLSDVTGVTFSNGWTVVGTLTNTGNFFVSGTINGLTASTILTNIPTAYFEVGRLTPKTLSSATLTLIDFDTIVTNLLTGYGSLNSTTSRWTASRNCTVVCNVKVPINDAGGSSQSHRQWIYKNGSALYNTLELSESTGNPNGSYELVTPPIPMTNGAYLEVNVRVGTGSTIQTNDAVVAGTRVNWWSIKLVGDQ